MRAQHIDRTKRAWHMGSSMKASFLAAAFIAIAFVAHPRPLAAQDTIDEPIDESTVVATINAADADLENDQANADKAKGTADDAAPTGSDATLRDSASQSPNQSQDAASNPAVGAEQANPAGEPAAATADGNANPQPAPNAPQMSSAAVTPGPIDRDIPAPSGPKSELALNTASLMKLANDLKSEVDKTSKDTLSITVVREADKIEQLARKMRSK